MDLHLIHQLVNPTDSRIVMLVMDGLGGLPREEGGPTELEAARTPHLDDLARRGECGLQSPIGAGITPGSGPAHLALFGYEPLQYEVGRGVLSALGIDFELQPADVAARGNFCTIGPDGKITDRRAGRIPTEKGQELCERLRKIDLPGAELHVEAEKEYRFVLVLRGENLSGEVADTDPQRVGEEVLTPEPHSEAARGTANIIDRFQREARELLKDQDQANGVLLRGFSQRPDWPRFGEVFGVRPAAIATYPMYRGVTRLLGMEVLGTGPKFEDEFDVLKRSWQDHEYFYLHIKPTDSAGEDGDFDRKVGVIEQVDALMPRLMDLDPDVVVVTGDHSTPAVMKYHSWHPVPVLIWSRFARPDGVASFGERPCQSGSLGPNLPATSLMPLALAHARKLDKFGA